MTYDIDVHARRVRTAVKSNGAARSQVVASWRRCIVGYGLDPSAKLPRRMLSAIELREATQRLEPLLFAAGATLERLQAALARMSCCALVAGVDGVAVHRRGREVDVEHLRRFGLWPGVDWSERSEGTNGIGTCLAEKRDVTIHGADHFLARNTDLSCSVAPIFDHQGELAGALDVTYYGKAVSEEVMGLLALTAREAASQIERANFLAFFGDARIIYIHDRARACVGLMAVDDDDIVLGATRAARSLLGITDAGLRNGIPAMDLQQLATYSEDTMARAERGTIRRALARTSGNVSASAKALEISRATMKRKLKKLNLRRRGELRAD
jgi:transcriptional regulator of acetoin/glycerol metabolism